MDEDDKQAIINGFRLIGEHGRAALEVLDEAIKSGEIDAANAGEAKAQIEELPD